MKLIVHTADTSQLNNCQLFCVASFVERLAGRLQTNRIDKQINADCNPITTIQHFYKTWDGRTPWTVQMVITQMR